MRVRNIPNVESLLEQDIHYIKQMTIAPGEWHSLFNNQHPIHIEIGMGKGRFLTTLALENPEVNYIGIEKSKELLWKVCKSLEKHSLQNIRIMNLKAENINEVFSAGEIKRIYLNFSDPWPKARHEKRRLTHLDFLNQYRTILTEDGEIHFKTDGLELFEFSLGEFKRAGFSLIEVDYDLHNSKPEGLVMTEYEMKFTAQGKPIYRAIASVK